MKTKASIAVAAIVFAVPSSAQTMASYELIESFTIDELADQGIAGADNDVETYRVIYNTVDPFGQPTVASGAVVLPVGTSCTHALAAYMHGTVLDREDVPSRLSSEIIVAYYLSAFRYVAVLPDYLGLGDGPGPHPYMHAASEASAAVDLLRAARELCAIKGVSLNDQLFLTGYSQGGHACMATHKLIEEQFSSEFQVTASAPCSGPYDASGVQATAITAEVPYPAPYYLPYVLFSYKHVYPWIYGDVSEVVLPPWSVLLPPLFLGNNGSGVVDDIMPIIPNDILLPTMFDSFVNDPDHPFREALRDNDVYDWVPQARVRMFYCDGDDHVFHENSLVAEAAMNANGALDAMAINAGAGLDHNGCAFPALLSAKGVFDALQAPCNGIGIEEAEDEHLILWPNPAADAIHVRSSSSAIPGRHWVLRAQDGRLVDQGTAAASTLLIDVSGIAQGAYGLELEAKGGWTRLRVQVAR